MLRLVSLVFFLGLQIASSAQSSELLEFRTIHDGPLCDAGEVIVNGRKVGFYLTMDGSNLSSPTFNFTAKEIDSDTYKSILLKSLPTIRLTLDDLINVSSVDLVFTNDWQGSLGELPTVPDNLDRELGAGVYLIGSYLIVDWCEIDSYTDGSTIQDRSGPNEHLWSDPYKLFKSKIKKEGDFEGLVAARSNLENPLYLGDGPRRFERADKQIVFNRDLLDETFEVKDTSLEHCFDSSTRIVNEKQKVKWKTTKTNQCDSWALSGYPSIKIDDKSVDINGIYSRGLTTQSGTSFYSTTLYSSILGIPLSPELRLEENSDKKLQLMFRRTGTHDWINLGVVELSKR